MITELLLVGLGLLLVLGCSVFVAAEFAFVSVDRAEVERAAESGDAGAAGVRTALGSLSTQLSGAQVGITATNLGIGYLAEPSMAALLRGPLQTLGLPTNSVHGVALGAALVLATGVTMLFGELVPKNLAIAEPLRTARAVQAPQRGFTAAMRPFIAILNGSANALLRAVGVQPQEELASAREPRELASLARRSAEAGALDPKIAKLLDGALRFTGRTAADVLTPRVRMHTVTADDPVSVVVERCRATGFSRFPVIGADRDDVIGLVHLKHAVGVAPDERAETPVRQVMEAPVFLPESLALDALLDTLRGEGLQIAVIVDEYGGTAGLVTLEDLVEEIVGEVVDEHDARHPRVRESDGEWSVPGLLRPDEVTTVTGHPLPEDPSYDTVGGLVTHALGRVPSTGDEVAVGDVTLVVDRMDTRRVDRIVLRPARPAPGAVGATRMDAERLEPSERRDPR